jgi:predicted nucleic acid-binding protein
MLRAPDRKVAAWLDQQPAMSIWTTSVTIFEIRFGLESMPTGIRRDNLSRDFEKLLASIDHRIIPFDSEAAQQAGMIMASRKLKGRPQELRDTMIAGIVQAHRATLATRNVSHFDDLSESVVNPWAA